jgi:predicted Zn finger-like uncharacterized protein
MRIVCPICSVAYDVPDSLLTAGRIVRCTQCSGEWAPVTAAAAPEPTPPAREPPPEPARAPVVPPMPEPPAPPVGAPPAEATPVGATLRPSAMDRLAAHPAWPRPSNQLRLAWAASVALLVLLGGAAYAWRGDIVAAWPPSARAYAAFGLHTETPQ